MAPAYYAAGNDHHGRRVHLTHVEALHDLIPLHPPGTPFVVLLAADTASATVDEIYRVADECLSAGAVYALAWGPGCQRMEDIFDEAVVKTGDEPARPVIMTTAHPDQPLEDALDFALTVAIPNQHYEAHHVLLAFVGNVTWYNRAHEFLEDALRDPA